MYHLVTKNSFVTKVIYKKGGGRRVSPKMSSGVGKGRPAMLLLVLAAVSVNTGKAARPIVPCATPDTGRRFVSPLSVRSARPTSPARQQRLLVTPHLRRRSISDPPSFPPGPCSLSGVPVRTPSSICRSCRHERRRICNGAVNRRGAYEANESWWCEASLQDQGSKTG